MQKLEFPSVHFLCLHSFHQHCFESYAENEKDCPVCWNKNKDILGPELVDTKPSRAALDSEFALKLSTAKSNSFAVLADFFGKGIFKEERARELTGHKKSIEKARLQPGFESIQGNVTEARLRLHEGTKFEGFSSDNPPPIDSFLENVRHSKPAPIESFVETIRHSKHTPAGGGGSVASSLPPIVTGSSLPFPRVSGVTTAPAPATKTSVVPSFFKSKTTKSSGAAGGGGSLSTSAAAKKSQPAAAAKNPFEDDDDTGPASSSGVKQQPRNPFEDDDDYDPSLNPFES
jgi:hypothetical protein